MFSDKRGSEDTEPCDLVGVFTLCLPSFQPYLALLLNCVVKCHKHSSRDLAGDSSGVSLPSCPLQIYFLYLFLHFVAQLSLAGGVAGQA